MTDNRRRGAVLAVCVALGLVAIDVAFGDEVQISGSYMFGAFVAAVLADTPTAVGVALLAFGLSLASPAWNHNFDVADYLVKLGIVVAGDLFAIETARLRGRGNRALTQQHVLAAVADLPRPGATLTETIESVGQLLVPRVAGFAAIDAMRADRPVRVSEAGRQPSDASALVTVPLRARGREVGALTVGGGSFAVREREFLAVLAGRVALALDNAGLSEELETVEQRMRAILASLGEAVTVQDRSGRLVFANQAAAELLGAASVEALLETDPGELMARFENFNEDGTALRVDQLPSRHVLAGEAADTLLVRSIERATGRESWRVTKSSPVVGPGGDVLLAVNVIEDVTDAKRAELGQRLLSEASAVLASSLDYESTLERVADLAVPALADGCDVVLAAAPAPDDVAEVLGGGKSMLAADRMLVPIALGERRLGVLVLTRARPGPRFSDADLELAEELGRRAATALENARLHTELGEVAETLQRSLLPPALPKVPGWSFRSLYLPATGETEVGGDFYDVFPTAAGYMALIGDVAGRGPSAASLTAMARYTLRTAGTLVGTPTLALMRLNENLRDRDEMALCSAAIVLLRDDAEASVVSAGHPLPLLIRDGVPVAVGRTGPLLGAFDHGHWLPAPVALEPGDVLVLFTDGVIDARSANGGGRFGEERLTATLTGATDVDDAVQRIRTALEEFAGGEHADDTAVLALMRSG